MPQKVIKFSGINRKVNEFQNIGACEELINLRPQMDGAFQVVKPKHALIEGVWYDKVYDHSWGETSNLIVVDNIGSIVWISKDGAKQQELRYAFSNDVELSFAGNIIVAYSADKNKQLVFKFNEDKYEDYTFNPNKITNAYISYGSSYFSAPSNSAVADDSSAYALNEAMLSAASGFSSKLTYGLCGASVVGCTYELEDGNEIWSTAFAVANSSHAYLFAPPSIDTGTKTVTVTGANNVELNLRFNGNKTKGVKRINIYSTRPIFPYEIVSKSTLADVEVKELSLEDVDLSGQLMYYQGSVPADKQSAVFKLKFGAELIGERIMDITPGCIERIGNVVSYNNRFHYFGSEVSHVIQPPTVSHAPSIIYDPSEITISEWIAYVKFGDSWKLIDNIYKIVDGRSLDIIYPMIGVEQLAFVKAKRADDNSLIVSYKEMFYVDLKESSAYNYAYAFNVTPSIVDAGHFEMDMESANQKWTADFKYDSEVFWKKEANALNVSAQYNPFVFPVEYSYSFGGEIRDIAPSYIPISSTQIGQYPITVFTSNGIFALEQSSGKVLYDSIIPLQPLVIEGKAVTTPYGAFFKSSKNLYILSGRDVANVSSALNGTRELGIREVQAYKTLCTRYDTPFHDFTFILSKVDFDKHIEDAILSYDPLQNEVYINSGHPNYEYSYVFNLDTKLYHKTSRKYLVAQRGGRYAIEATGAFPRNVVYLHNEDIVNNQPILLQSRPLSLEQFYTHIQRLILLADAKLEGEQYMCVSVFGSDNLNDWKCIMSAQKMNTTFRHIRTNKAPKSYREYIILITGMVNTNTDLSDIIADYTVVQRRLG